MLNSSCGKKGAYSDPFFPQRFLTGAEWEEMAPSLAAALRTHPYPAAVDVRPRYRSADSEKSTSRLLYSLRGSVP
jgi:hypothetical protein